MSTRICFFLQHLVTIVIITYLPTFLLYAMQGHLTSLLGDRSYLASSLLKCSFVRKGEGGWLKMGIVGKSKTPAERNRCICFPAFVCRRRNTIFLLQCERLRFRLDIRNSFLTKAKVKSGIEFLGKVMGSVIGSV